MGCGGPREVTGYSERGTAGLEAAVESAAERPFHCGLVQGEAGGVPEGYSRYGTVRQGF